MTPTARTLSLCGLFLFALSCSEGPEDIPQGGAQFLTGFSQTAPSGTACPATSYLVGIGNPPPDLYSNNAGGRIANGDRNTSVSCRVRGRENVTFNGSIEGVNTHDNWRASLLLSSGTLEADGTGTFDAIVSTPVSSSSGSRVQLTSESPCSITGVQTGSGPQWGDGLLWGRFVCNSMRGGVGQYCKTEGVIVFENCD